MQEYHEYMSYQSQSVPYHADTDCPICGSSFVNNQQHHCRERVLRAIDAAHTRAMNEESAYFADPMNRQEGEKLHDGFAMLNDDEQ